MSSLEFDGFSLTQGFDIKNLMDSASFQCLTAGVFKLHTRDDIGFPWLDDYIMNN